ncbi:hypothetical protein [Vulcanisaeta sp. JCM 16159]|uniref:hypothetical protein n=1 Tax=Vulcanisaeta sp. JCM 16159 TaxID=1295371 RepID=UPI0006CF955D|nr:hypothetical protein [Vulcanisaeta sp. JCM 16159]
MIIPIPILIIAIMIGMIVLGLIRPPLTVIIPLLGIYAILMLIPYILPNFSINQYLSIKYILLPVIGLAIGYGISILASKYMNVDIRSLLGLKQDQRGIKRPSNVISKPKVEKRTEIKPEDLDRLINETINELKSGASTNETLGSWIEYYDGWTDAIISISRRFMDIKGIAESMNKEVPFLLRARQYESKAAMLGLTLRRSQSLRNRRRQRLSKRD